MTTLLGEQEEVEASAAEAGPRQAPTVLRSTLTDTARIVAREDDGLSAPDVQPPSPEPLRDERGR